MPPRLADRLRAARDHLFVGREQELGLFRDALQSDEPAYYILYVSGPGGIGKTTLMRAFMRQCDDAEIRHSYIDTRDVEPGPEAFLQVLRAVLDVPSGEQPLETLAARAMRHVLFIDAFDTMASLDSWFRERFLPDLPENVLLVMASRTPLPQAWRVDPGWQSLIETIALRNLPGASSRDFLTRRGVPEAQHPAILGFTHGHPLAISLVADLMAQRPDMVFQPEEAPHVVRALLEQFVQKVPGPAHRAALEVTALVRYVTEDLLAEVVATPNAHVLFEWLRTLSFIEADARGLSMQDLAREVLSADLKWRNPDWHAELQHRARQYYTVGLKQSGIRADMDILSDYTYLHREHPLIRPFFDRLRSQWAESDPILPDAATKDDCPVLIDMVREHEGEASAKLAEHWFDAQPGSVVVFRSFTGDPLGFMVTLALGETTPEARDADPATRAAWAYLESHAPLRAGERATMFRFWMAHDTYQDVSPVQSLIFVNRVQHYLRTPGLAFSFIPCHNPEYWQAIYTYAGMKLLPEAAFEVAGQTYGVFGHDWRAIPPTTWLDQLAGLRFGNTVSSEPEKLEDPILVLSKVDFANAVRDALKAYTRPGKLTGNPLLRSRVVVDLAGADAEDAERVTTLRALLDETAASLDNHPREAKYYRAVHRTYLQPAPTQERAAELLDLPFSTFRRHLKRGINRIAEILWQQETGNL